MATFHLAEFNFAKALAPMEAPKLADFVKGSDPVNAVADRAPGFVWRYQPQGIDTFNIRPFEDQSIYITLSVWESVDALRNFVYKYLHEKFLKRREEWFSPLDPHLVLWWVPVGHLPSIDEAKGRLELLKKLGPTPKAFDFSKVFPAS